MRSVIQRVGEASVTVDGEVVGAIERGLVTLLGVAPTDTDATAAWLADKIVRLRVFPDDDGRFNRSLLDVGGDMLVVSQFTLFADARKGTRPSFTGAAAPDLATELYERFCDHVRAAGVRVATGVFGASMQVALVNDGPVTITLERE